MIRRSFLLRLLLAVPAVFMATCKLVAGIWVYDGPKTLAGHLTEDHGLSNAEVSGRSEYALVQIHSAVHEHRYQPGQYSMASRRTQAQAVAQNPPNSDFRSMTTYGSAPRQASIYRPPAYRTQQMLPPSYRQPYYQPPSYRPCPTCPR